VSSLLAVFAVCPKILFRVQSARARCPLSARNKIFGQTTWQLRGSFRVQTARAHGVVCRLHARCPLVQTAQGTRLLGRLRGSYVAAFVCRLHARCPLVQTAQGTRFLGRLRGSYVAALVCRLHTHGVLCRLHTEQDFGQTTWHRRGNCRSLDNQASTRLKTVSHERAHRLTPKRSLDTLRACKLHKILLPGGYFPIPRRGFPASPLPHHQRSDDEPRPRHRPRLGTLLPTKRGHASLRWQGALTWWTHSSGSLRPQDVRPPVDATTTKFRSSVNATAKRRRLGLEVEERVLAYELPAADHIQFVVPPDDPQWRGGF